MRLLHRIWAFVGGYFWLPCPRCGRMFGGHEVGGRLGSRLTCSACRPAEDLSQILAEEISLWDSWQRWQMDQDQRAETRRHMLGGLDGCFAQRKPSDEEAAERYLEQVNAFTRIRHQGLP